MAVCNKYYNQIGWYNLEFTYDLFPNIYQLAIKEYYLNLFRSILIMQ